MGTPQQLFIVRGGGELMANEVQMGVSRFTSVVHSHDVRPSATAGAQVIPGNNTYGDYLTVLGTPLANDCYMIDILVREVGVSGSATDSLTTIGIDRGGGTSFTDTISHLLTSYAGEYGQNAGIGYWYRFPLFIPAGSTIGAKGTINNATVGEQRVSVRCHCRPSNPRLVKSARFVRTYGQDTAASKGTAVTFGTASEGSWTEIGTVADTHLWGWTMAGAIVNQAVAGTALGVMDMALGDASNKREYLVAHEVINSNIESHVQICHVQPGGCANGEKIYVRGQAGGSQTPWSAIVYAVGG